MYRSTHITGHRDNLPCQSVDWCNGV